jgi:hypothetical protein
VLVLPPLVLVLVLPPLVLPRRERCILTFFMWSTCHMICTLPFQVLMLSMYVYTRFEEI